MRGHTALVINEFKGLWSRGNVDSVPVNHGVRIDNSTFNQGSIQSRKTWNQYLPAASTNSSVRRMFVYNNSSQNKSFLVGLANNGVLFTQQILPVALAVIGWFDFANNIDIDVATFGGRAYIAVSDQQGYRGTNLYVFDGIGMRESGGLPPTADTSASLNAGPLVDPGNHYYGISFETSTGFITKPRPILISPLLVSAGQGVNLGPMPIGPAGTVARRVIGTRVIPGTYLPANGLEVFPTYFIPGARVPDNTSTATIVLNYTDTQLLDDASYLQDIYDRPPGGSCITTYHNRLVLGGIPDSRGTLNQVIISRVGDPETFEKADGTVAVDPTSDVLVQAENNELLLTGVVDAQEYRDTLYIWKLGSTYGLVDNGDVPSTWPVTCIDQAIGAFRSGVVTILDSGSIGIEYVLVASKSGLYTFNGLYNYPEASWKIKDLWERIIKVPPTITDIGLSSDNSGKVHFVSDPVNKVLFCLVSLTHEVNREPHHILYCDFSETSINDSDYFMNVKWSKWTPAFGYTPHGLVGFDIGTGIKILTVNPTNGVINEYDGAGTPSEIPTDEFFAMTSNLLKDEAESRVLHFSGYTIRARGNTVSNTIFKSHFIEQDYKPVGGKLTFLADLVIPPVESKNNTVLTNFLSQQAFFVLTGKFANIDRIQIWMKPTYKTIPI